MAKENQLIKYNDIAELALEGLRCGWLNETDYDAILGAISEVAGTEDVVHCHECFWGYRDLICTNPKCTKSFYGCPVPRDHFCSYGEQKERGGQV